MFKYSLTLSVYKYDKPGYFCEAIDSIIKQTIPPDEIILTVDGPVTQDLDVIINKYAKTLNSLKVVRIFENKGLGIAHKIGVENCLHELIAIMDADDIAVPDRFEKQLKYFEENPDVDILGGYICEFIDTVENIVGVRDVPLYNLDIKKYLKKRCPINHMTVMFKKTAVLKSGNYQDWCFNEDYYLWCRMLLAGCNFANISDVLVYVRVGKDMYNRRGGLKYYKSERKLQKFMLDNKIINFYTYIINVFIRLIIQVLLPNSIRSFVFQNFFRKSVNLYVPTI